MVLYGAVCLSKLRFFFSKTGFVCLKYITFVFPQEYNERRKMYGKTEKTISIGQIPPSHAESG